MSLVLNLMIFLESICIPPSSLPIIISMMGNSGLELRGWGGDSDRNLHCTQGLGRIGPYDPNLGS